MKKPSLQKLENPAPFGPDFKSAGRRRRIGPSIAGGLLLLVSALATLPASGATIAFGSAQTISGDSDVSTAGTLDRAYNFGLFGVPDTTVNGVTFAAGGTGFNQPSSTFGTDPATTVLSALGGSTNSNNTAFGSSSAPFASLSSDYQTLLRSGIFYDSAGTMTLTINGLEIGAVYQVQIFVNDSRGGSGTRNDTVSDPDAPGNTVVLGFNMASADGGLGQFVIGTFTADATSEEIDILGNASAQINAMQLRLLVPAPVPEPATCALLAATGSLLLFRRRRRA